MTINIESCLFDQDLLLCFMLLSSSIVGKLTFFMQDWKCIVSMLLDANPMIELTDVDATNLVRLLYASAKKAVGEKIVPANDNRKPYHNKAQKVWILLV